jgi:hypothetical protein
MKKTQISDIMELMKCSNEKCKDKMKAYKKIEDVAKLYSQISLTEDKEKVKSLATKVLKYTTGEVARRGSYAAYLGIISDFGEEPQKEKAPPAQEMQFNFAPPNPITQQ